MSTRGVLPVTGVLLAALLAGCAAAASSGPGSSVTTGASAGEPSVTVSGGVTPSGSGPATPSGSAVPAGGPRYPLTGGPAPDPATAARAAVAVPLLTGNGFPDALSRADVVFQEVTRPARVIALFQSQDTSVGPIGATRPTDPMLLAVLRPAYAYDHGPSGFVQQVQALHLAGVDTLAGSRIFTVHSGAVSATTGDIRAQAGTLPATVPLFSYATPGETLAEHGARATHTLVVDPGDGAQTWTFGPDGLWHLQGTSVAVTNLVVLRVDYKWVQLKHPDGPHVRSARTLGSGTCVVASGAVSAECGWRRPGLDAVPVLADAGGVPIRLSPGRTWVLLSLSTGTVSAR